ncbi:C2H2 zinc finger protein [Aspergillus brunneoviolaceus CBS 621.78]|uniref:C2H2 zinc finger protein n=1 Tax=Aspergillus brunneoviolaceus CBS 621.78 TaxID=1450534 RepID=A0ACD1FUL7_9EURO|nr:C2H2 zinc finger protein [Aspergillus brunneoviolaceus CBS 621.78]RAH40686.1 C2H2 zinc finger protein [Aspergillus brunneoviolaceus CBS 621.78]
MAALIQSNNEPVSISAPLPGSSAPILSTSSESIAFFKQPRPDSSLTSIASAGLNVSRSRELLPPMTTASSVSGSMDRPLEQEKGSEQHNSQVAREALGASEKQQDSSAPDCIPLSSDQMQVDSNPAPGNAPNAFGTAENNPTLMTTSTVASPGPIEDSASHDGEHPRHREGLSQEPGNKAFSYPMPTASLNDPRRGLSLPNSGFHKGQRSPSAKKHRCPYCSTEFTRHHNLKSHLLTHSQEKPYVCQTCQSRFRRLHDLKRHTKLHTGERPHICPKCGRRFARGDALARHNKGQGGCAGRRASMGSYAPEDEYGDATAAGAADDTMDGLVYAEPERMDEEEERRLNMPSIKKHDLPTESISRANTAPSYPSRQPSTYPPIASGRPSPGGLFPPPSHGGSSASTSPISQSANIAFPPSGQPSGSSAFPTNITESPKPLSPNALSSHQLGHNPENNAQLHRAHSPGLSQSFQQQGQQPYSRAGPSAASGLGLPPPQPSAPQLPPPLGLSSSESRFALHSQGSGPPPASTGTKHTPSHSHSSNHSGPLTSKPGPEAALNNGSQLPGSHEAIYLEQSRDREEKLWAYIRSVHEELNGLKAEVASLRVQLASANVNALATPSVPPSQPESGSVTAGPR